MSKRRQLLEFTDDDIGVLRRSDPEEELSHGAWVVGGHQDEIVAGWQLGLQGDRPRVGEVQASHQAQLSRVGQRSAEPPVHLEEVQYNPLSVFLCSPIQRLSCWATNLP